MASNTSVIALEQVSVPEGISFCKYLDFYCYTFDSDLWQMRAMLDACKSNNGIVAAKLPWLEPVLGVIENFRVHNYLICYENDFAGMPDENCFTIPVLNGKVISRYIVDETNSNESAIRAAYKVMNFRSPYEY